MFLLNANMYKWTRIPTYFKLHKLSVTTMI